MVKGGYVPGRTHPTDRARGQTTAMPTAVAAARQSYADHPMVRLETAPPGPCHAVSLQETLSGTFTACATVILVCAWENLTIACPKCNTNKGHYNQPICPLLDPHVDDVDDKIAFGGPMALPRGGVRAGATINRLRLNRPELLYERAQLIDRLYDLLDLVQRAGNEPAARVALWLDIDDMTAADGQFTSACRQFLAAQLAERGMTRL